MKALRFTIGLLAISAVFNSCVKNNFDTPLSVSKYDPNVPVNMTIAQLSSMALSMQAGQYATLGDSTIYGIVTADDRSGNFYKQIIIQDSTGGIAVTIAQTNLYNDYPIGRKVYIKLKGLIIVNYKGLPEIAYSVVPGAGPFSTNGIPPSFLPTTIIKASYPNTVTPVKVRLTDLASNGGPYLNMLVELENMEFDAGALNLPYAAPSTISTATARFVHDCPNTAGLYQMYNSGYATFQPYVVPSGNGTITCIYSIYTTPQLLIRDTTDIHLNNPRPTDCP